MRHRTISFALITAVVLGVAGVTSHAETDPPAPLASPAYIDHADVLPPLDSFRYWLDTVTTTDEEFADVVRKAQNLPANKQFTVSELREERTKRLYASFDFDQFFAEAAKNEPERDLSVRQRAFREEALVRYYLGSVVRDQFAARNIRAITAAEDPNFANGTASLLLDMYNTVEKRVIRYKVHMKLYPRGLIWRWYKTESMGEVADRPAEASSGAEDGDNTRALSALDAEIARLNETIEGEAAKLREAEARLQLLRDRLAQREAERLELERVQNPYGSPELALRTAHRAMREKDWDRFKASHSARVRDNAGPSAKSRFLASAERDEVRSVAIIEQVVDPVDSNKMRIKARLTLVYREVRKYDSEERESYVEGSEERRVVTLTFVREDGNWLLDDDL